MNIFRIYFFGLVIFFAGFLYSKNVGFSYGEQARKSQSVAITDTASMRADFHKLNVRIKDAFDNGQYSEIGTIIDSVGNINGDKVLPDYIEIADFIYLKGAFKYNVEKRYTDAISLYKESAAIRVNLGDTSNRTFSNCLYNIANSLYNLGDLFEARLWYEQAIESYRSLDDNPKDIIDAYRGLVVVFQNLNDMSSAIEVLGNALKYADSMKDSISADDMSDLYMTRGNLYYEAADYEEALRNYEFAEDCISNEKSIFPDDYIEILDRKGSTYYYLGDQKRMEDAFLEGIQFSGGMLSVRTVNLMQNYAIILGNSGRIAEGEEFYSALLKKLENKKEDLNYNYYWVAQRYAEYLREYDLDINRALAIFEECYSFYGTHFNNSLGPFLIRSYSLALLKAGRNDDALKIIQSYFFPGYEYALIKYDNPPLDSMRFNGNTLSLLDAKYQVLMSEYNKSGDLHILEEASEVSEIKIAVLEKIRFNISEEASRILLGDRYRDFYLYAINSNTELFKITGKREYLEKAFRYGEKSKAAGLLAATREIQGMQFHIPADLSEIEQTLQRQISLNVRFIDEERDSENPDNARIEDLRNNLVSLTAKRDSLKLRFEKEYPDYYKLKYNTDVVSLKSVTKVISHNSNYLSYILSDTLLYAIVVNRRHQAIVKVPVDSSFTQLIATFRQLLARPKNGIVTGENYRLFQTKGNELYGYLIAPVKSYLISEKLVISPDNILAFLPFETLQLYDAGKNDLHYRTLPFLMKDYETSYTYSATLLSEKRHRPATFSNNSAAFAPLYNSGIDADSVMTARQSEKKMLRSLPYARDEAIYVSDITSGKLFLNDSATITSFKREAGKYDIVHLAMHAVVNDEDPMFSKLVFGSESDSALLTSDIYGIPLSAKMVVLSACNTGIGTLHQGEGILSLARGFIYSGSRSVVLSLWEVEDKSGTEIVKSFYDNIKNGNSKSKSLRKSRMNFLNDADQLRAHPYFWSTLVIYGDDSPIYLSTVKKICFILIPVILLGLAVFYFRKRIYS